MRKNIYGLLLLSLIMVLGSCYGDKGNYDYEDVNEITVDLGGTKYTYVVGKCSQIGADSDFCYARNCRIRIGI